MNNLGPTTYITSTQNGRSHTQLASCVRAPRSEKKGTRFCSETTRVYPILSISLLNMFILLFDSAARRRRVLFRYFQVYIYTCGGCFRIDPQHMKRAGVARCDEAMRMGGVARSGHRHSASPIFLEKTRSFDKGNFF